MNTTTMKSQTLAHASLAGAAQASATLLAQLRSWYDGLARYVEPRPLTAAEEAAALRDRAFRLLSTEPSFARDLLAAANRHEGLPDDAM